MIKRRAVAGSFVAIMLAVVAGCAPERPQTSAALPVSALPLPPVDKVDDTAFALQGKLTQGGYVLGRVPEGTVALTIDGTAAPIASDGRFVAGFHRDAEATAEIIAQLRDGSRVIARIAVSPRQYNTQHIPGLPGTAPADPAYQRLRASERARIDAARTAKSETSGWQQQWIWPVTGRISGVYGSQRILGGVPRAPHFGVDIAAPSGTAIVSPADGVVVLASPPLFSLEGNLVMIDHGMGVNSAYLHLKHVSVKAGDRVVRGQTIGTVGSTGRSTGPHLHWGVNWLDRRLDPMLITGPMPGR